MIHVRIGSTSMHVPKLVGALVIAASLLMFFLSIINLFETIQSVKIYPDCASGALASSTDLESQKLQKLEFCKTELHSVTGFYPISEYDIRSTVLSPREMVAAFMIPIANVFWWLAIMLIGTVLYRSGQVIVPIEEQEKMLADRSQHHKK
jgi:hypothetical protein